MNTWCLTIKIRKNDQVDGKRLQRVLLDLLMQSGISGASVWNGVDGFGKRGRSKINTDGISVDMPVMIEVMEEKQKNSNRCCRKSRNW